MTNKLKKKIEKEGYKACQAGASYKDCPYTEKTEESSVWFLGFDTCIEEDYNWTEF